MKRVGIVLPAITMLLALAGCSGGSTSAVKTIQVLTRNMTYEPKEITVEKGKAIKVVFTNQDSQLHDFSIDHVPAKVMESHSSGTHNMGTTMPDVHTSAEAGATGEVQFTPTQSGTYTIYCTVAGHKDAGMQATLVVK